MNDIRTLIPYDDVRHATTGSIVYSPGGRFGPRIQQDIQLVLLYTGEMNVTIDGSLLHVPAGHVVLLKPGHEESFAFAKDEETWHRWIAVHVSSLTAAARDYLDSLPVCQPLSDEMNRLADMMLTMQPDVPPDDPLNCSLGLAALQLYPAETMRMKRRTEKHPSVYMATSWIRDHYADEMTLPELASRAGISAEHLVRLFNRYESVTPIQYLWNYRIERGIELLAHTGLTISEVADRCGFKNPHHFARLIKQSTGKSPSQIRKISWGGSPESGRAP